MFPVKVKTILAGSHSLVNPQIRCYNCLLMTRPDDERKLEEEKEQRKLDWTPHNFNDDCPAEFIQKAISSDDGLIKPAKVYRQLSEHMRTGDSTLVRKLSEGELFEFKPHDNNTAFKIHLDSQTILSKGISVLLWGAVLTVRVDGENQNVLAVVDDQLLVNRSKERGFIGLEIDPFEIGLIYHLKSPDARFQQLKRVNWVEEWRFGHGKRTFLPNLGEVFRSRITKPIKA